MKCGAITHDGFPMRCDLPQGHEPPCDDSPATREFCGHCGQPVTTTNFRGTAVVTHVHGDVFCGQQFEKRAVLA